VGGGREGLGIHEKTGMPLWYYEMSCEELAIFQVSAWRTAETRTAGMLVVYFNTISRL
jgi:hypothetical protein